MKTEDEKKKMAPGHATRLVSISIWAKNEAEHPRLTACFAHAASLMDALLDVGPP